MLRICFWLREGQEKVAQREVKPRPFRKEEQESLPAKYAKESEIRKIFFVSFACFAGKFFSFYWCSSPNLSKSFRCGLERFVFLAETKPHHLRSHFAILVE